MKEELSQSFRVEYHYKVFFTESLFAESNPALLRFLGSVDTTAHKKKLLFVIDQEVLDHHPYLKKDIPAYFLKNNIVDLIPELIPLSGGEAVKNDPAQWERVLEAINEYGIDRHSFVAAIGGGAVLDAVGYAAAIAHRGIRHIRIPTTVLSQNDSGVGVKNGINFKGKKNFLGTFSPPVAIFNDFRFLETLDTRDWRSGIAEAVKVALIKDPSFFEWLEKNCSLLVQKNKEAMRYLIYRCAELHLHHIAGADPFEHGSSRPLDFGHWLAHKLEPLTGFSLRHGEAVAIGIAIDSIYSVQTGLMEEKDGDRIIHLLLDLGFELYHPVLIQNDQENIRAGLREFQEHLGGQLTIMLLEGIGKGIEVNEMDAGLLRKSIDVIKSYKQLNVL